MIASGKIDVGKKRKQNQDQIFISNQPIANLPNLYIVADGMGGANGGEIASNLAIQSFCDYIKMHEHVQIMQEEQLLLFLKRAVAHANYTIYTKSLENEELKGMGTTLTLCTIRNDRLYVAHVGDSRVYVITHDEFIQITNDHSYVQQLVDEGHISEKEAKNHPRRHAVTRAVGTYDRLKVDTYKYSLEGEERILLCSDGLTTMLLDETIKDILKRVPNVQEAVEVLVDCANNEGGYDNIAVIIMEEDEVNKTC